MRTHSFRLFNKIAASFHHFRNFVYWLRLLKVSLKINFVLRQFLERAQKIRSSI